MVIPTNPIQRIVFHPYQSIAWIYTHSFILFNRHYTDNLRYVDRGIAKIETLINEYFKDNQTAYVFTADHGMTDWGK